VTRGKVAVILVNWNNHADTLECLRSLQSSSYQPREVLVVENGSRPESVQALRGAAGCDLLIESAQNLGFTGGNNLGIRTALERGADFVFVLNNDTIVNEATIATLVNGLEAAPDAGIAAPKIRFYKPDNLVWYAGGRFSTAAQNPVMIGYQAVDDGRWDVPGNVDFASGCAMLIRREILERLGGFADEYFAVWEDVELSLRVRSAGHPIAYVPGSLVWHKESAASGGLDAPGYVYYQMRNRFLFLGRRGLPWLPRVTGFCYALAYVVKRSLVFVLAGHWAGVAAIAAGARDGMVGRGGERR